MHYNIVLLPKKVTNCITFVKNNALLLLLFFLIWAGLIFLSSAIKTESVFVQVRWVSMFIFILEL